MRFYTKIIDEDSPSEGHKRLEAEYGTDYIERLRLFGKLFHEEMNGRSVFEYVEYKPRKKIGDMFVFYRLYRPSYTAASTYKTIGEIMEKMDRYLSGEYNKAKKDMEKLL